MKQLILQLLEFKQDASGNPMPFPDKPKLPRFEQTGKQEYKYHTKGGDWHIIYDPYRSPDGNWSYTHEDYDGPGDIRHGHHRSPHECKEDIDQEFPETHNSEFDIT